MAEASNLNIVLHPAVQGKITLSVKKRSSNVLMDVVLKNYALTTEINGNVMRSCLCPSSPTSIGNARRSNKHGWLFTPLTAPTS